MGEIMNRDDLDAFDIIAAGGALKRDVVSTATGVAQGVVDGAAAAILAAGDAQVNRVIGTPGSGQFQTQAAGNAAGLATGAHFLVPLAPGAGIQSYRVTGAGTSVLVNTFADAQQALAAIASVAALENNASINRRIQRANARRKLGKKGRIYIAAGQSLSVRRDYTAGQPKLTWMSQFARQIVGGADRNADANVAVSVLGFNASGDKYESLVQFVPSATQGGKVDGFAMMADCPTVCGIYAVGARDYTELRKGHTTLFSDTSMFMSQAVALLRDEGVEDIEFIISFNHGEAETDNIVAGGGGGGTPTPAATYARFMAEWIWDFTCTARLALDDPEYDPVFLIHQMAGSAIDDAWREVQRGTLLFADRYPNVHVAGPTPPFGMQVDRVHVPGEGQVLVGEFDWHLAERALSGLPTCLRAQPFRRTGATITVPHTWADGPVQVGINAGAMTDASGFNGSGAKCIYGVEVTVNGTRVDLTSVTPAGLLTTIVLAVDPDVTPGGTPTVEVRFGQMTGVGGNSGVPSSTPRCNIRSAFAGIPSRFIPTFMHQFWLTHEKIGKAVY